jgi:4-hydroxybenzoate decarboxylase
VTSANIGDFRLYFASLLERGEVNIVEREVDPHFEVAAVIARAQKESDRPILFRNVKGAKFPVVANLYGSFSRMAEMLSADKENLQQRWMELLGSLPTGRLDYINEVPVPVDLQAGTLNDLPQIKYREKDVAPYITAGVFLALDPESGIPNLSFARCMMLGDDRKMHCCIDPPHDLAKYQAKAEAKGEALPVAILIGAPPPVFLAATASLPIEQDELGLAALIAGGRIDMRPCECLKMMVPVESEIVIEATIRPGERAEDGPFGEFLGYYCGVNSNAYILDVLNVSWRQEAFYHALLCGSREDLTALSLSWGGRIFRELVETLPGILDVRINPTLYASIVKIDKQSDTHAREVIDTVFRVNPAYNRMCIVVDKDIDIDDLASVWWSFLTRGDLHSRVHVLSGLPGVQNANYQFSGYLGIDATTQPGLTLVRATTPGEEDIRLSDYFIDG